ncbi:uncharacterized protein [Clytia hemisphaerica]|uniref:SWIM-type domain-containing protein n=1 Tax=Clytia hemisphaerica TaxID=252671 RepID=A0A7M5XGJ1_9CNID
MNLEGLRSTFINVFDTQELVETLMDKLPFGKDEFKIISVNGSVKRLKANIDCKLINLDSFIQNYNEKTDETLRVSSTRKQSDKSLYEKYIYLRCHHKTRYTKTNPELIRKQKPSKRFKNTDCPFSLCLKFKKHNDTTSHDFNCNINLEWNHNHPTRSLQALSFKDIQKSTQADIAKLFDQGFTPGPAYREFWRLIKEVCSNELELHKLTSDRSRFPRRTDFNKLFTDYHRQKFGSKDLESMFRVLGSLVEKLKNEEPESIINFQKFDAAEDDPFILVIVTGLMLRVHKTLKTSSEMIFVDSSGGMEEYNLRVFLVVTHSFSGALPLGVIVTSDETTETLTRAFEMFSSLLPDYAFYSSRSGPGIVMTDNCGELHDALHAIWPMARLLLCFFHIMQQVWRWLFDKNNKISQVDRPEIIQMFRNIVYCSNEDMVDTSVTEINEAYGQKYKNLQAYMNTLFEYKERWCLAYRQNLLTRGNNTNNFVEAQFLVLKDNVLNRTKEININGLIQKLVEDFNDHFKVKLISIANGRYDGVYSKRFKGLSKDKKSSIGFRLPSQAELDLLVQKIVDRGAGSYLVPSFKNQESFYFVDTDLGVCECEVGRYGTPCKHQYLIWTHGLKSNNFLPYLSCEERKKCSYIAIGKVLEDELYESIHDHLDQDPQGNNLERVDQVTCPSDSSTVDTAHVGSIEVTNESHYDSRRTIETTSFDDAQEAVSDIHQALSRIIESHKNNRQLLQGVLKFQNRLKKYSQQPSKLTSAFHTFGSVSHYRSRKQTGTSMVKKQQGKIRVQPAAVTRRVTKNGSKTAIVKGMNKRNPFENKTVAKKRPHNLAQNIERLEPVPKKAEK